MRYICLRGNFPTAHQVVHSSRASGNEKMRRHVASSSAIILEFEPFSTSPITRFPKRDSYSLGEMFMNERLYTRCTTVPATAQRSPWLRYARNRVDYSRDVPEEVLRTRCSWILDGIKIRSGATTGFLSLLLEDPLFLRPCYRSVSLLPQRPSANLAGLPYG